MDYVVLHWHTWIVGEYQYIWRTSVTVTGNGHAVAQVVSHWLPTTAAWVCIRAEHVGFVVDKAALGQIFSEYFHFSCQSYYSTNFSIILIDWGWHKRPIDGRSL
jgi:hypothetical protein